MALPKEKARVLWNAGKNRRPTRIGDGATGVRAYANHVLFVLCVS
jgi:hypothetical protein